MSMPENRSIISVWYGISKSGTTGSPKRSTSTFSVSSFPIGTDGSMIFGMVIISFFSFSSTSFSSIESASTRSAFSAICRFSSSASSFFPWAIRPPICLEILFFSARSVSTSCLIALFLASSSNTSSTSGSFSSWNLFLIFCFTISGFVLTNFISNIVHSSVLCFRQ